MSDGATSASALWQHVGLKVFVQGGSKLPYTLKKFQGGYSCTCRVGDVMWGDVRGKEVREGKGRWCVGLCGVTQSLVMPAHHVTDSMQWVQCNGFHSCVYVCNSMGMCMSAVLCCAIAIIRRREVVDHADPLSPY